jgi:polyketide synthase PksN
VSDVATASAFTPSALDSRMSGLLAGYPPELFNDKLHHSIELLHRYTLELSADVLVRLGVMERLREWRSLDELTRMSSFAGEFRATLCWLLDQALELGYIERASIAGLQAYRLSPAAKPLDLKALREIGLEIDPFNAATLDLLDCAASVYPAAACGEGSVEHALFDPRNIGLWLAYFHNENPSYAVNNWMAVLAAAKRLADKRRFRVLEIGAGAGSASELLLRVLGERKLVDRVQRYVITEPGAFFRRRAERVLRRRFPGLPLEFKPLDIDRAWSAQGALEGEFDLVFGVNVMHVAHDLVFSLSEARKALAPEGWLAIGECLHSHRGKPIFPELIFQLLASFRNVRTDIEFRPAPGFLTPNEWRRAFARAGFPRQEIEPDVERIREICPNFLAGAVCAQRPDAELR